LLKKDTNSDKFVCINIFVDSTLSREREEYVFHVRRASVSVSTHVVVKNCTVGLNFTGLGSKIMKDVINKSIAHTNKNYHLK
jgi:hypothetical protein